MRSFLLALAVFTLMVTGIVMSHTDAQAMAAENTLAAQILPAPTGDADAGHAPRVTPQPVAATQPDAKPPGEPQIKFDPKADLLSLHYDHAPDKDDGHSAAADRTMLESIYGADWLAEHVIAVSGAYGTNKKTFNKKSDAVMDAVWKSRGGWVALDADWATGETAVYDRWVKTLQAGGDVYVKEGGQSDITTAVCKRIVANFPDVVIKQRIHVVQHSNWNEDNTTPAALAYTKEHTHYVRIKDANRYLNKKGGDKAFEQAALAHPMFGESWKAAFAYYSPNQRLDFSDTGELMHILALGELDLDAFRTRFLTPKE